jgi:hypothetical protein
MAALPRCCRLPTHQFTKAFRRPAMTTLLPRASSPVQRVPTSPAPQRYPDRDFGVGYGRSSGYATTRHYAVAWTGLPRFRCR